MKRLCSLLLAALMLLIVWPSAALAQTGAITEPQLTPPEQLVDADGHVIFPLACVEQAVRDALGIPEGGMTPKQLAKLGAKGEELRIVSDTAVTVDLSILQLCARLKSLYLEKITPANLGAVTACKSLTYFGANCIEITDLRFLAGLNDLRDVWISQCPCKDISAVTDMPRLSNFSIDTKVQDLAPLYACKKITEIAVAQATDAELNTLLDHLGQKLKSLGLNTCAITDTTFLRITGLRLGKLMLDTVPVKSVAPLWQMKTLGEIQLFNMHIDSLEGIQTLKKLNSVSLLGFWGLTDFSPLFTHTTVRSLKIADTEAPVLTGIEGMSKLDTLTLENLGGTVNLTPLYGLPKLRQLNLEGVTVDGIAGIEALKALTGLTLNRVKGIADYTPLVGLGKLQWITTDMPENLPDGLTMK